MPNSSPARHLRAGPRWSSFRKGWAVALGWGGQAHWFERRQLDLATPVCGKAQPRFAGELQKLGKRQKCSACSALVRKKTALPGSAKTRSSSKNRHPGVRLHGDEG